MVRGGSLYASDSDENLARRSRGYSGVMVSTSLGSDASFRMPSPVRVAAKPKSTARHTTRNHHEPSPHSSLEELIDSFRASASSFKFSTARSVAEPMAMASPRKNIASPRKNQNGRGVPVRGNSAVHPSVKQQKDFSRMAASTDFSDDEAVGVSPMPKLLHAPKPKPTLSIAAPGKSSSIGGFGFRSGFQPAKRVPASEKMAPLKLSSLKKIGSRLPAAESHSAYKERSRTRSPTSSPSNDSTMSSILDHIDAPDSDDAGEISVDDLISQDLRKLRRLVSSSHELPSGGRSLTRSLTNEDVEQAFRKNTRFGGEDDGERTSPFRLNSPHYRSSVSSLKLRPVRSLLHEDHIEREGPQNPDIDDSFDEDLRKLKSKVLKKQEKKRSKETASEKAQEEERALRHSSFNIASLREVVDTIDKNLLIALRPFEKMKQEQQTEDAKIAATEENAIANLELPLATQTIVENLEQTFGGQTRLREAELKAEKDAAVEAKSVEVAKKKLEDEKKAQDDAARVKMEEEILSLIPMRGKLFTSDMDINDALVRLEAAETLARRRTQNGFGSEATRPALGEELANLKEFTLRRVREIEELMQVKSVDIDTQAVDWRRSTFHVEVQEQQDVRIDASGEDLLPTDSYPDIIKAEIVDKLDFTILRLKHALSIDNKEAEEAETQRIKAEKEAATQALQQAEDERKREDIEANARAAKQRVMGLASLQDLTWSGDGDARLRENLLDKQAIARLERAINSGRPELHQQPTEFHSDSDEHFREQTSRRMKLLMEAPYFLAVNYPNTHGLQSRHRFDYRYSDSTNRSYRTSLHNNQEADDFESRSHHICSPRHLHASASRVSNQLYTINKRVDSTRDKRTDLPTPRAKSPYFSDRNASPTKADQSKRRDKLVDMKREMHDLQSNRREKAHWFHASARHRQGRE